MRDATAYFNQKLTESEFAQIADYIYSNYGIKMPPTKKLMLEGRLYKRLRETKKSTFREYLDFVFETEEGKMELINMVDVITTNKTDFFREPHHFEYLKQKILPKYENKSMNIWSSACSTGEEIYTIAITMEEYQLQTGEKFNYHLFASDISTKVLKHANQAVYDELRIKDLPLVLKQRYFLKSKNNANKSVRMVAGLRDKVKFSRINLLQPISEYSKPFDLVFCRNVLIYFDRETQESVLNNICDKMKVGATLMLGHSESISGLKLPLKQIKPTIFEKI